jgi:hypothetical protein
MVTGWLSVFTGFSILISGPLAVNENLRRQDVTNALSWGLESLFEARAHKMLLKQPDLAL